jgi:general stress protein 26
MSRYEEGLKLLEESCGYGKDNIVALSTIAMEPSADGTPFPYVRDVDAYYEDGVFYVTTWAKSNKMQQIAQNKEVAFAVRLEGISGNGIGENLGWVLDPKNAELRAKLRKAFTDWYDQANNEKDENCVILAIRITRGTIFRDHGAVRYNMDFVNKLENEEGKIR